MPSLAAEDADPHGAVPRKALDKGGPESMSGAWEERAWTGWVLVLLLEHWLCHSAFLKYVLEKFGMCAVM